ncbi:filamentous hemagglutinin N-terminal domain-containing protein [Microcoleus sp. FACHB-1515]|uniref:two-partner secretion domain-containing protein n=1 Tax=Cyanophyceae TaxID=3028117 RepID=UPI001688FFEC|nr:filamentous hemagglutinin N-terminal domain-containing protein [Microcoleus sp. FACHB-1515]MBD2088573.1 filamentous hemagglutinin N-terminal domain-containing protein [Microcoleus sp. FACHB-1515]
MKRRANLDRMLLCLISFSGAIPAQAQIAPDRSLPNASVVTRDGNTLNITGGTTAESNLFHSFERFSVPQGDVAHFQNGSEIRNIFGRVTGTARSQIDGTIRTNGTANLFLLNPNGIVFGADAALNVAGSFVATTADRITFADGSSFRAVESPSPLLTISAPIGLQFGRSPAEILSRAGANLEIESIDDPVTSGLETNQTLALIGGDVTVRGGFLRSNQIELGSVGSGGSVSFDTAARNWNFRYDTPQFQTLHLSEALLIGNGINSNLRLSGEEIILTNESNLIADGAAGGGIRIRGSEILLTNASNVYATTLGDRNGQPVQIQADRFTIDNFSLLNTDTVGAGDGGDIRVRSDRLILASGGQISALANGAGNGGDLTIQANAIELSGRGSVVGNQLNTPTGLFTQAQADSGDGGNLSIATQTLRLVEGAQIGADTSSEGNAGTIRVAAEAIELNGIALRTNGTPLVDADRLPFPSGLFVDSNPGATGSSGAIVIETDRLSLQAGAVLQVNTESSIDAGNLTIRAADFVEVTGRGSTGLPTLLFGASGGLLIEEITIGVPDATGRGGTIRINTPDLRVEDGGAIAVSSLNRDRNIAAGNLLVQAETIQLQNQGRLLAETASGQGGDLRLQAQQIVLRGNSSISTTAGVENRGGNGGDIRINTDFILSTLPEDNDITANAYTGNGGNVRIAAQGILGIVPQDRPTTASDITASSEFGNSGAIVITSPTDDPSRGLVELPANLIDASSQIAQGCGSGATARQSSEFVVTGRGGLPPSPIDSRSSAAILSQWATSEAGETVAIAAPAAPSIVEAQSWVTSANGEVMLVAAAPIAPAPMTIACR